MVERVEHWFNRRWGRSRYDVFLLRTTTGWQVLGRKGGDEGKEVTHDFDDEDRARAMLQRMMDTIPPELANWAKMSATRP